MAESSSSQAETELTMCDVLEEEQELEEDANAVLGGSDDTNCSYDKGYVPRQALYACITCSSGQPPSGVCLACTYKCHDGHEIIELYTKRNFRCDCGNSKFAGKTCLLKPDKEPLNSLNKYNQNFRGLYCSCSRPYPDLEDNTPDEMIQCIMCEDWYHGRHIGGVIPDEYAEMICSKCMGSHKFLYSYLNKFHYVSVNDCKSDVKELNGELNPESSIGARKTTLNGEDFESTEACCDDLKLNSVDENKPLLVEENKASVTRDTAIDAVRDGTPTKNINCPDGIKSEKEYVVKHENPECFLNKYCIQPDGITHGAAFWPENWRKELCKCVSCMDMYPQYQCDYLLNLDDTILAYEEKGKSSGESQYDKGLNALSQLDRVKQMEAIRAYTSMKGQLKEYLKEFANNKRTVCESDIKEFFERISKRQKLSNGVPHFCR